MASGTKKAPTAGNGGAFKNTVHGQAISIPTISQDLTEIQTNFVVRRTRLQPELARAVAEIFFGRAA